MNGYAKSTGVATTEMNRHKQILSPKLFDHSDMHSVSICKKEISFPYQGHKHPCLRTTSNLEKKKKYLEKKKIKFRTATFGGNTL